MTPKIFSMEKNPSGFIAGMPNEIYHSLNDSISNSGLSRMAISPAHYRYQPERKQTRAMVLGSALHCAILEPNRFASNYLHIESADRRSSVYKEAIKNHPEDMVLITSESDYIRGMQASVHANPAAYNLIEKIDWTELSLFTKDPATGVYVRIRMDAYTDGCILDLKTTSSAAESDFSRSIFNYRYHCQAAFYIDAFKWATGEDIAFKFIAVESDIPHASMVYKLDDISLEIGRAEYRKALNLYADCLFKDEWPTYPGNEVENIIALPEWAINRFEAENETDEIEV